MEYIKGYKGERSRPSDEDLARWQLINEDLLDWLYTGLTGRFQIAGHQQIDHWAVNYVDKVVVEIGCGHGPCVPIMDETTCGRKLV